MAPGEGHSRQRQQKGPEVGACDVEGAQPMCLKNGRKARMAGDGFHFERMPLSP